MLRKREIPSAKAIFSAAASAAATAILIRTIAREYVPDELRVYLRAKLFSLFSSMSSLTTVTIDEYEGLVENQLFRAAEVYLGAKISPSTQRFRASIPSREKQVILSMDRNQVMVDVFEEVEFKWKKVHKEETKSNSGNSGGERARTSLCFLELMFENKHRDLVLNSYFPHILSESFNYKQSKRTLKIHMLKYRGPGQPWASTDLDHPSTFETLAMDPKTKKMIMDDLDMFVRRKDFYRRVGKAWKRGYLLFGPPGTGKSSLIAAIANYLKFDIYDLELTDLSYNSDLRKLIMATANRSILVVEDIDCSIDLDSRKNRVKAEDQQEKQMTKPQITLSGLLNFIDGLWSSCGDERIIIFTTNHKERLDPALLRPGRMDVHLHMSYCTPCGFRTLASNYLGLTEHPLFSELEQLVAAAKVTPAEVGEQLMKTEDPEKALKGLLEFLKGKEEEKNVDTDTPERESKMSEAVEESKLDGVM